MKPAKFSISIFLLFSILIKENCSSAQDLHFFLYKNAIDSSENYLNNKKRDDLIKDIQNPDITIYLPSKAISNRQAVIICPGGGYSLLAYDIEGTDFAKYFNSLGITAIVLKYRLPKKTNSLSTYYPINDLKRAIRITRFCAQKWNIDTNKIGVLGFSAGGHLAATLATHFDYGIYNTSEKIDTISSRPNFVMLVYPVISMIAPYRHEWSTQNLLGNRSDSALANYFSSELNVKFDTPPVFMVHSLTDKDVSVENSIKLFNALKEKNIKSEMHIFSEGDHGFAMATKKNQPAIWLKNLEYWLQHFKN